MLHGEAVAIDMAVSTELSRARGLLTGAEVERVFRVLAAFRCACAHSVQGLRTLPLDVEVKVSRPFALVLCS